MDKAHELISFYEKRGWDWRSALAFTLCQQLFGKDFRIYNSDVVSFVRRKKRVR